ncbi:MAG: indole-3-glycerol phosphate synthase TrpC [Fibrobacterota bacterium]
MKFSIKKITEVKKEEIYSRELMIPKSQLAEQAVINGYNFKKAIFDKKKTNIIAELKKASPSAGIIRENFNPGEIALNYQKNGASAVSVLTDEKFFMGKLDYLSEVRSSIKLPILRKDFIVSEYQILEASVFGASAVLLITSLLDDVQLSDFREICSEFNLAPLFEIHNEAELERAQKAGADIIGINNRNLSDPALKTDLSVCFSLAPKIPKETLVIAESGIKSAEDIKKLKSAGVNAFLAGEALMRAPDPGKKLKELLI